MNGKRHIAQLATAAALAAMAIPLVVRLGHASGATDARATHIDGERTRAAFAKGQPLVETATYKIHASRREAPGLAEIHTLDTDIIYVLQGTATIVTGGRARNAREVAPHEIRGTAIDGGAVQRLAAGDVFIVPAGLPHRFTEVQGAFLYYVVKTTSPGGGEQ